jgi:transcriptional regulator with XRE-family HTH domain
MTGPTLDVEALYVALDRKRRQERISGAEMLRHSGVGTTSRSVWTRLAHGEGPSADNLIKFLVWLGETDVSKFVRHGDPVPACDAETETVA